MNRINVILVISLLLGLESCKTFENSMIVSNYNQIKKNLFDFSIHYLTSEGYIQKYKELYVFTSPLFSDVIKNIEKENVIYNSGDPNGLSTIYTNNSLAAIGLSNSIEDDVVTFEIMFEYKFENQKYNIRLSILLKNAEFKENFCSKVEAKEFLILPFN